jgi:hypothetical protein
MDEPASIDQVYTVLSDGRDEASPHVDIVDISPFSPNPTLEFADGSIRMYRPLFGPTRLITEEKIGAMHVFLVTWSCVAMTLFGMFITTADNRICADSWKFPFP